MRTKTRVLFLNGLMPVALNTGGSLVSPYYAEKGYGGEATTYLIGLYEKAGNRILATARAYQWKKYYIEKFSYMANWVIPLFLLFPYSVPCLLALRVRPKSRANEAELLPA